MAALDPHKVLGVPSSATQREVKQAYRALALRYHPDTCQPGERAQAAAAFREVSEAYARLSGREHTSQRLLWHTRSSWLTQDCLQAHPCETGKGHREVCMHACSAHAPF